MTILDLSGMRAYLDGDKEEEREIVQIFIEKTEKDLAALNASVAVDSLHDWQESCHSLKGSAALLGAFPLRDLCHDGEILDSLAPKEIAAKLSAIELAYAAVVAALAEEGLV
jgi:HPt (histidine-containing phosphotransfer) domain-containing protein